jgi:hypothetical protein
MAEWRAIYASLYHDARVKRLSIKARYVYTATIVNANSDGSLPWDVLQLAKWADVSVTAAQVSMAQLEASGLLRIADGRASHPQWELYQGPAGLPALRTRTTVSARGHADVAHATDLPTDRPLVESGRSVVTGSARARAKRSDTAAKTLTVPPVAASDVTETPSHARHAAPADEQRLLSDDELAKGLATVRARLDAAEREVWS